MPEPVRRAWEIVRAVDHHQPLQWPGVSSAGRDRSFPWFLPLSGSSFCASGFHCFRCFVDCCANPAVGAATANVTGHRRINIRVGWSLLFGEQGTGTHDLARLTITALRDVQRFPGHLHGMRAIRRKAFDGGDLLACGISSRCHTRAYWLSVDVNGAGAAEAHAAAELCAFQIQFIPKEPEQWHFGIAVKPLLLPIDSERNHRTSIGDLSKSFWADGTPTSQKSARFPESVANCITSNRAFRSSGPAPAEPSGRNSKIRSLRGSCLGQAGRPAPFGSPVLAKLTQ